MSCASPKVVYSSTTLYVVGGYITLRSPDDPEAPGQLLANSHLYTLSLTGNRTIDLSSASGISTLFQPPPQRLPDSIPRVGMGNFFHWQGRLYLFGGFQTNEPIYLPNGTMSLADRPEIRDQVFTYEISSATWLSDTLQSGLGVSLSEAARAYDSGREVFWMYGGGTETENNTSKESYLLWKFPGSGPDCMVNSAESGPVPACQINTTTVPSAKPRPTKRSTMIFVDIKLGTSASSGSPGSEGILVLLGGTVSGILVCYHSYAP